MNLPSFILMGDIWNLTFYETGEKKEEEGISNKGGRNILR